MMSEVLYLSSDDVVEIHDRVIEASGGLAGVRDVGLVDSAVELVQNDVYYPDILTKVAHLIYSLNKGHCFNDGNKRTSLSATSAFLLKNHWPEKLVNLFVIQMEEVVVWVADNFIEKEDLKIICQMLLIRYYGYQGSLDERVKAVLDSCRGRFFVANSILTSLRTKYQSEQPTEQWLPEDVETYKENIKIAAISNKMFEIGSRPYESLAMGSNLGETELNTVFTLIHDFALQYGLEIGQPTHEFSAYDGDPLDIFFVPLLTNLSGDDCVRYEEELNDRLSTLLNPKFSYSVIDLDMQGSRN